MPTGESNSTTARYLEMSRDADALFAFGSLGRAILGGHPHVVTVKARGLAWPMGDDQMLINVATRKSARSVRLPEGMFPRQPGCRHRAPPAVLERDWVGVSGSILDGIDEILTVTRLELPK